MTGSTAGDRWRRPAATTGDGVVRLPTTGADVVVRPATPLDGPVLRRFLVYAANWNPSRPAAGAAETLADDHNARYVDGWGAEGDFGAVADDATVLDVGAAWCRLLGRGRPGYGYVADDVPELSIAVAPERRGQGIGSRLMAAVLGDARRRSIEAVSLSVEIANPALRLYERSGFRPVGPPEDGAFTMVVPLAP